MVIYEIEVNRKSALALRKALSLVKVNDERYEASEILFIKEVIDSLDRALCDGENSSKVIGDLK